MPMNPGEGDYFHGSIHVTSFFNRPRSPFGRKIGRAGNFKSGLRRWNSRARCQEVAANGGDGTALLNTDVGAITRRHHPAPVAPADPEIPIHGEGRMLRKQPGRSRILSEKGVAIRGALLLKSAPGGIRRVAFMRG